MTRSLTIPGPAGDLQASFTDPGSSTDTAIAVLCHPHPLYGGNMDDAVLDCLAAILCEQGVASLRFNFRGVGTSGGKYSGTGGEVNDLLEVIGWVRSQYQPDRLILGGYSFGASIVCEAEVETVARIVLVAPPVLFAPPLGRLAVKEPEASVPVDIFVGDQDEFTDLSQLRSWSGANVHVISDGDHFFSGRWTELESALRDTLRC